MAKENWKELKKLEKKIRCIAEDLRDPRNRRDAADPFHDADKLDEIADELEKIGTNVRGSGTGSD